MTPIYQVIANGNDITANLRGRLLELKINDQRGLESDSLELVVDDTDAGLIWPRRGVELQVWIGYLNDMLHFHGKYVVDEIAHSGPPDQVRVLARAPNILEGFKGTRTRSWDKTTLGNIIRQVAADNRLKPAISEKLDPIEIVHWDQTNESDLNLLTRLGKTYDAVAKAADGRLIFVEEGRSTSVSGKPMPVVKIDRQQIASHHYTVAGRKRYIAVEGLSYNYQEAKLRKVTVSQQGIQITDHDIYPLGEENLSRLRDKYPTLDLAEAAAKAEWGRLGRSLETLELDLRQGLPGLRAETKMPVTGIRPWINGDWVVDEVTHLLSATDGLSTRLKADRPDDYNANDTTS